MIQLNHDISRLSPIKWVIQAVPAGNTEQPAYFHEPSGFLMSNVGLATIYDEKPTDELLASIAVRESRRGTIQIVAVEVDTVKLRLP